MTIFGGCASSVRLKQRGFTLQEINELLDLDAGDDRSRAREPQGHASKPSMKRSLNSSVRAMPCDGWLANAAMAVAGLVPS